VLGEKSGIMLELACVADVPFHFPGEEIEQANERAWGEQKMGNRWGGDEKKEEKGDGVRKKRFLPHPTRSQFCFHRVILEMEACYTGYA